MKAVHLVVAALAVSACQSPDRTENESQGTGVWQPVTIENAAVLVTFGTDASLSVFVKATGYTWSAPAPANPYTIASRTTTPHSIDATLTRDTESWKVTISLTAPESAVDVSILPSNGRQHVELPAYPYPFTMDSGNYVQN